MLQIILQRSHVSFSRLDWTKSWATRLIRKLIPGSKLATLKKNGNWHIFPSILFFLITHIFKGKHLNKTLPVFSNRKIDPGRPLLTKVKNKTQTKQKRSKNQTINPIQTKSPPNTTCLLPIQNTVGFSYRWQ